MKKSTPSQSRVPKSPEGLLQTYGALVRRRVHKRVVYGMSQDDAVNEVWARVLAARVLERYARARSIRHGLNFKAYFRVAVDNHLKNIFRTLERRSHPEQPSLCEHNHFAFECERCREVEAGRYLPPPREARIEAAHLR